MLNKKALLTPIILFAAATTAHAQFSLPKEAFLEKWKNSSEYLIAVLERIPETSLEYKPTERQMSVKEQLLHIRSNMLWLGNSYFNSRSVEVPDRSLSPETKEELLAALRESFRVVTQLVEASDEEMLQEPVEFFAGPKSRLQILNLLQDHVTHHRGQLIVYLNLMDIEPPRYSGW